jgi:methyltransferase (TIGR00027 family)
VQQARPSQTALRVALRRAAHQIHDSPVVFADPIAVSILERSYPEELLRNRPSEDSPVSIALRAFLVARSRYAEDKLSLAVAAGIRQYVLLGAGLDTFAYRNPYRDLQVFEVDCPSTQRWKRELLGAGRIPVPNGLSYVPVDFERESLAAHLEAAGFVLEAPAFFAWLGVVPYLTLDAFRSTVGFISACPPGSGLVLDYGQPRVVLPYLEQLAHDSLASRVRLAGEPFQLFFRPGEIASELPAFYRLEDIGSDEINARYFNGRGDQLAVRGKAGRLLSAWL